MRNRQTATVLFLLLSAAIQIRAAGAAADPAGATVKHAVFFVAYDHGANRFVQVSADGKVQWEHKLPSLTVMFQLLPGGNIVFAHGGKTPGASEIDRDHKVIWDYISSAKEVLGCERLPSGNTLIAEEGPCRAVEVNPTGQIVSTVNLTSASIPHHQVRRLHQLENGHILVAHEGDGAVREYDRQGKVVWEYKGLENVFEAVRLKNGNTLIGGGTQKRVIEVLPDGKTVWELKADEVPDLNLIWITSLQVLPSGNYVIANFLRGHEGQGAHAFEITHDKKVVWRYADHQLVKSLTMLQVLDVK
jgi:outer membrane protein assembly factor BamB